MIAVILFACLLIGREELAHLHDDHAHQALRAQVLDLTQTPVGAPPPLRLRPLCDRQAEDIGGPSVWTFIALLEKWMGKRP